MKKTLTLLCAAIILMPAIASAKPGIFKKFQATYPNSQLPGKMGCMLCHEDTDSYNRNPYGMEVEKTLATNGGAPNFAAIEALDSDGDSFTNIEEINANTAPGDKNDHPASH